MPSENNLEHSSLEYAIVTPQNPRVFKAHAKDVLLEYSRVFKYGHVKYSSRILEYSSKAYAKRDVRPEHSRVFKEDSS